MAIALVSALAAIDTPARRLLVPGGPVAPLALSRTQAAGARSTALAADGTTTTDHAADAARFDGTARWLLVEGARSNLIRNPRFEATTAGSIGSGGAFGTFMTSTGSNLAFEVLGTGSEAGLPYLDVKLDSTGTFSGNLYLEAASGIPLAAGASYATSLHVRVMAGSLANITTLALRQRTDAATVSNGGFVSLLTATGAALSGQRFRLIQSVAADATAGRMFIGIGGSGTGSVTLRLGAPQCEAGGFDSTPILPPAGTPGVSARGAELVTASLATLGLGGACTLLWSGVIPRPAPTGIEQTLLQLDDGGDANRFAVQNLAGGATIRLLRGLAGATATADAGSMLAGTPFRLGLALDGTGRAAVSRNGAAAVAVTGGPASGLTTLRLGHAAAGAASLFGAAGGLRSLPFAVPDAGLPGLVAALPL